LGSYLKFLLVLVETERKDGEVVEHSDVVREHVNDEIIDAFVLPSSNVLTWIILLAIPVKNDSIVPKSERKFENEDFILSSDFGFVFIERLALVRVTVAEISSESLSKSFLNFRIAGKNTFFLFLGRLRSTHQCAQKTQ